MMAGATHFKGSARSAGVFVIRLSGEAEHSHLRASICEDVARLGGQKVPGGFGFASAHDRAAALDVLGDKYGARCFAPLRSLK